MTPYFVMRPDFRPLSIKTQPNGNWLLEKTGGGKEFDDRLSSPDGAYVESSVRYAFRYGSS